MTIKKNILWLIGILFAHYLHSQSNAECPVQIMNKAGEDKFFLFAYASKLPIDSVILSQGSSYCFKVGSEYNYPIFTLKSKKGNKAFYFFKDKGAPVRIEFINHQQITVRNSRLNALWDETRAYQDSAMKVLKGLRSVIDSAYLSSKNNYEQWAYERLQYLMQADTFVALRFLNFHLNKLETLVFANPEYMDSIHLMMRHFPVGSHPLLNEEVFKKIEDLSYLRKGASFYHFFLEGVNSDTFSTEKFSDAPLLLDFWASWCKPCREKNQDLKKNYDQIRSKGIQILGVSLDDKTDIWKSALEKDHLPWPQGILFSNNKKLIQQKYNAHAIPLSILFSREGKVLQINPPLDDLIR